VCVYDAKLGKDSMNLDFIPLFILKTLILSISMPMRQLKPVTSMAISRAIRSDSHAVFYLPGNTVCNMLQKANCILSYWQNRVQHIQTCIYIFYSSCPWYYKIKIILYNMLILIKNVYFTRNMRLWRTKALWWQETRTNENALSFIHTKHKQMCLVRFAW
jgi:hypothetical protein